MKKEPPQWLIKNAFQVDIDTNSDTVEWCFCGDYFEIPQSRKCSHEGVGKPEFVKFTGIMNNGQEPHGIGQCSRCGRIFWLEIKMLN